MFKWGQDKRSRSTECSNLSGEEYRRENMTIRVLNSDRGFGAASRTLETKMIMYIIAAKLNLTFGTTGKAMAVKRLQKWSVETRAVA